MNYKKLHDELISKPPLGWRVVRYVDGEVGGVYFWPLNIPQLVEKEMDSRLGKYSLLFEFHVTSKGDHARILGRARFNGIDDVRWRAWRHLALEHCSSKPVKNVSAKRTKSVGLWDGQSLQNIAFNTPESIAAEHIRCFLENPPSSLACFIAHLL